MEHGIFGDERVMQFFITMKAIAEKCFHQLHTISQETHRSADIAQDSFRIGLSYIQKWNQSIVDQEATNAISKYPDIVEGYKHALMQYVKHVHRDTRAHVKLTVPPFKHFLHWFLSRAALTPQLQRMAWVKEANFAEKDVFYRETLRQTISRDCLPSNLNIQKAAKEPLGGGGTDMGEILPSDSISNVAVQASPSLAPSRHANHAMPVQKLTSSLLKIHTDYPSTTATPCLSPVASSVSSHPSSSSSTPVTVPGPAQPIAAPVPAPVLRSGRSRGGPGAAPIAVPGRSRGGAARPRTTPMLGSP